MKVMHCKESFCLDHIFWVLKFTVDFTGFKYLIFFSVHFKEFIILSHIPKNDTKCNKAVYFLIHLTVFPCVKKN